MSKPKSDSNIWYKTHVSDPTPISTTQNMLIEGSQPTIKNRSAKKQISFQTYPMDDTRFDLLIHSTQMRQGMTTTYSRDYKRPYGYIPREQKNPHDKPTPDVLFNRLPINQFGLYPYASTKFMDDHMFDISESRKKTNFFRQMRNTHYRLI